MGGHSAELAAASDIVLTSLPGRARSRQSRSARGGILEGSTSGSVYIDLSTSSPTLIRSIAEDFAAKGVSVLDAPVSGGPVGARTGRLAVMVGGDREVYDRVKPALDAIGDKVSYIGPIGSGSIAKLMHNCIGYGLQTIVAECLTLGVKAGVGPAAAVRGNLQRLCRARQFLRQHIPEHFPCRQLRSAELRIAPRAQGCQPRSGTRPRVRRADERGQHRAPGTDRRPQSRLGRHGLARCHELQEERAGNIEVRIEKPDADALEA